MSQNHRGHRRLQRFSGRGRSLPPKDQEIDEGRWRAQSQRSATDRQGRSSRRIQEELHRCLVPGLPR